MAIVDSVNSLKSKNRQELIGIIRTYMLKEQDYALIEKENEEARTAMAKEYRSMKKRLDEALREISMLKAQLRKLAEQNIIKTKEIFGRSTEKLSDVLKDDIKVDENGEMAEDENDSTDNGNRQDPPKITDVPKKRTPRVKQKGKRDNDLAGLPVEDIFELDTEELDRLYGAGNWRIAHWRLHKSLQYIPASAYVEHRYYPVLSAGLEHSLVNVASPNILLKKSIASSSLVAEILYNKFFLMIPSSQQEILFSNLGIVLSKQTITNWIIRFAADVLGVVRDYMEEYLKSIPYNQCDETHIRINKDGRKAGRKSYVWVHTTSELLDVNPVVLFCAELTRNTDHLRDFYKGYKGYITSDGYCAYHCYENENPGTVKATACLMHLRRYYAKALDILGISSLPEEKRNSLPEVTAINMLNEIFHEDGLLSGLSADERRDKRKERVAPILDRFYEHIEGIDLNDDTVVSSELKKAVNYSINQKKYMYRFLDDGSIPCHNGNVERHIRPLSCARHRWLFCDSIDGAHALAIIYSVVETARANNAKVYYYLKYLLENVPKYLDGKDRSFLPDMMPWSLRYREYEKESTGLRFPVPGKNEYTSPPRPPSKKERVNNPVPITA